MNAHRVPHESELVPRHGAFGRVGWVIIAIFVVALVGLTLSLHRKQHSRTAVADVFTTPATVATVLDLCYMTDIYVDVEGGTYGGLLKPMPIEDAKNLLPNVDTAKLSGSRVLWLFQFRPSSVEKEDLWLGDGWLKVTATKEQGQVICLSLLPSSYGNKVKHIRLASNE